MINDDMADSIEHGWDVRIHPVDTPSKRRLQAYYFQRLLFRWLDRPLDGAKTQELQDALQAHQLNAELRMLIPRRPRQPPSGVQRHNPF